MSPRTVPRRPSAPAPVPRPCARLPLRLADRYFLAAHTGTGRLAPRVDPVRLGLGCAGGLLAELLLEDEIEVVPAVRPSGPGMPPDFLAWSVLREIRADPERDVRTWVRALAAGAAEKVRARLTIIDVLREVPPAGFWRGAGTGWRPAAAAGRDPAEDVRELFRRSEPARTGMITVPAAQAEVALAVLAAATGVTGRLGLPRAALRRADARAEDWRRRLPAGLRAVVAEVAAAADRHALTPRR